MLNIITTINNKKLFKLINSKKIRAQSDPFNGGIIEYLF